MKVKLHKKFTKQFSKLNKKEKLKCKGRLNLFLDDPFNKLLKNHALQGKYKGLRSINMGGDLRAIYEMINSGTAFFVDLDTHSNLYS